MSELKILLPGEPFTLSNGETIIVSPVPFGKLRIFSGAVAELTRRLSEAGLKFESVEDWRVVFDVAFEETVKIMALVLDRPREWFDTISLSDGLGLLNIIIEQNFNEDTKKNLKGLIERVSSLLRTQSRPLSQQATTGTISSATLSSRSEPLQEALSNSGDTKG